MQPLLIDEGLPHVVAEALSILGWDARAIGHQGAPAKQSADETNCRWCEHHGAVLVTNDLGRKSKAILKVLEWVPIDVIFVKNDLRGAPAHHLALALLRSEIRLDALVAAPKPMRRVLTPAGGLRKR